MAGLALGGWMHRRAERTPDLVAIRFEDQAWTYAELDQRVRRAARVLRSSGVRHGDSVAYLGANHPALLELLFAASSLGAITLPVNDSLPADTVEHIVRDAGCRVLVHGGQAGRLTERLHAAFPEVTHIPLEAEGGYEQLLAAADGPCIEAAVDEDDAALLVYTSGTTGPPKGVALTHANLLWNVVNLLISGDVRRDDVTLAIAPFSRAGGLGVTVLETLLVGGTVVVMRTFDAGEALRLIQAHAVTVLFGGPDLMQALVQHPAFQQDAFASVRVCYTGGAPVPRRLLDTYQEHEIALIQGYGLSEAAPVVMLLDPDDMVAKAGSAGRPVFFTDVRIARPDGSEAASGEVGEILVAGPNVMKGYWNHEQSAERFVDERWLRTGDAARRDADGFVTIVGRIADAYEVRGRMVHPGVIESVLRDYPGIADVAVVPVPVPGAASDPVAVAFIEPTGEPALDLSDLRRWASSRIAKDRFPDALRTLEQLPRNPAGKVLRDALIDQGRQGAGR